MKAREFIQCDVFSPEPLKVLGRAACQKAPSPGRSTRHSPTGCNDGLLTRPVTVAQGTRINRSGRVFIRPDQGTGEVFIGGATHIVIDGTVTL